MLDNRDMYCCVPSIVICTFCQTSVRILGIAMISNDIAIYSDICDTVVLLRMLLVLSTLSFVNLGYGSGIRAACLNRS